jgi:3-oxoacyl-[acyl-carrier-protein] synthase-3
MAFLEIKNVRLAGVSAGVPSTILSNLDSQLSTEYEPEAFVKQVGVKERRYSEVLTTSDLCYGAAERLIADLGWEKSEIDGLIFVSQNADFFLPATACILQDRLGLSKECYAADVNLGCSGWVYGLSYAASLMTTGTIKKVLLMAGDAKRRTRQSLVDPIFGSAGTVTALEYDADAKPMQFHFGTDGSGYDAIIIPDGGARNQMTTESFKEELLEGKTLHRFQVRMKGMDVFSFGISTAPKTIKKLAANYGFDYQDADYFVFHQANMQMLGMIQKKLKIADEKMPTCMYEYGNTSSASIPLTMITQLKGKIENKPIKFICCGFGVGLSWGTVALETNGLIVSDLVEMSDEEADKKYVI